MSIHWMIIIVVAIVSLVGIVWIARSSPFHYGIVLVLQIMAATVLCIFFQSMEFYHFALPLQYVLILVTSGFGLYVLLIIHFRPRHKTFPFLFIVLHLTFILEYILEQYVHFITYTKGWDIWDSYTWYWIYTWAFTAVGEYFVPERYRKPVSPYTKVYWLSFIAVALAAIVFAVYVLRQM